MDEQADQKIKELQAKIDDVAGFVSLASHQLRSSPAIVRWYAELLLDEKAGKLTDEQKKYVNEIYAASQRMIDFINALLNVSRLELGTVSIRPEQLDVCAVTKRVVEDAQPQIKSKNLILNLSLQSDLPALQADPKLLRLIIKNLLSNAVKFTPANGTIGLAVAMDIVDGKSSSFKITVSDHGTGIPKDQQAKIFTK